MEEAYRPDPPSPTGINFLCFYHMTYSSLLSENDRHMTTNMYIIPIEKNVLGGKECNHSLMMHGIKYIDSFFYLDYQFSPGKFLNTQSLPEMIEP